MYFVILFYVYIYYNIIKHYFFLSKKKHTLYFGWNWNAFMAFPIIPVGKDDFRYNCFKFQCALKQLRFSQGTDAE